LSAGLQTDLKRENALAGDWGRANKEAGLALPGDNDGLGLGRGGTEGDQDDRGHRSCDWRSRVHDDAQLAVIGVSWVGVQVGNLSYGQEGKKNKAHHRNRRKETVPGAAPAEKCSKPCQSVTSPFPFYKKSTHFGRLNQEEVALKFCRVGEATANAAGPGESKLCCHGSLYAKT
jgi:hypothetical protein